MATNRDRFLFSTEKYSVIVRENVSATDASALKRSEFRTFSAVNVDSHELQAFRERNGSFPLSCKLSNAGAACLLEGEAFALERTAGFIGPLHEGNLHFSRLKSSAR